MTKHWINCRLYQEKPYSKLESMLKKSGELVDFGCYLCHDAEAHLNSDFYKNMSGVLEMSKQGLIEEAQFAADSLLEAVGENEGNVWLFKSLNYARDKRFDEARDALVKGFKIAKGTIAPELEGMLENIYQQFTKVIRSRKRGKVYNKKFFKGQEKKVEIDTTYVVLADENLDNTLQELLKREDKEKFDIVVVKDKIDGIDHFKEKYKERLATVETEHKVWDRNPYNTEKTNGLIRVVLKNDNNGYVQRALNMGIRKAMQSGSKSIQLVGYNNELIDAVLEFDKKRTLNAAADYKKLDFIVSRNGHIKAPQKTNTAAGKKKTLVFVGTTKENTHGVPVVMNNIRTQLEQNPNYDVFSLISSFDNHELKLYDKDGNCQTFKNREDFVKFAKEKGFKIDIMHVHSWHVADSYIPFHTKERDGMAFADFLAKLDKPKMIFTDHCNPPEILSKIKEHNGVDYAKLTKEQKEEFLRNEDVKKYLDSDWKKGWQATQVKCTREIMGLADVVAHVSGAQLQEEIADIMPGLDPSKHTVVYNGLDLVKFADDPEVATAAKGLREKYGLKENEKVMLYAGRADKEKGIFDLAEAFKMLENDATVGKVKIIYLGNMDGVKTKLGNGKSSVLFPGLINDRKELAAHYKMADVVVQPTWGECFNQVVGEGLVMGTPAVVSDVSGPAEVYVSKGVAVGCKPKDPADLAEKLKKVLTDSKFSAELSQKGKKYVQEKLSVQSMYQNYLNAYESLLNHQ
ncbi:MAG: glycosyltransferase family 4 protein [Candidatus Woesearchaeota archaeon]